MRQEWLLAAKFVVLFVVCYTPMLFIESVVPAHPVFFENIQLWLLQDIGLQSSVRDAIRLFVYPFWASIPFFYIVRKRTPMRGIKLLLGTVVCTCAFFVALHLSLMGIAFIIGITGFTLKGLIHGAD